MEQRRLSLLSVLAGLLLVLGSSDLLAEEKTFRARAPLEYEDGATLPLAELAQFRIDCGRAPGGPYDSLSGTAPVTALDLVLAIDVLGQGAWYCIALVQADNGQWSRPSNEVFFTLATRPAPVEALTVE